VTVRRAHRRDWARLGSAAIAVALLSGCAVGPDFVRPSAPDVSGYTPERLARETASSTGLAAHAQVFFPGRDLPGEWWRLFRSKPLTSLVGKALAANPDLQAAQAALRVARENFRAQQGLLFPAVDANFTPMRQKVTDDAFGNTPDPQIFNLFTGQLNVSYVPDVFGGTRRSIESLEALAETQRFQLEASYLTLTSNLAGAAVQEASLRAQIMATQSIIKIESDLLDLVRRQRTLGQLAEADVAAQEAALAQAEQALPPLEKQLAQERDLITALIGSLPSQEPKEKFELWAMELPRDLPVSLPSKLVEQRPDVRQAEANLHSASALVGVAIANRLPNVMLTANLGSAPFSIDQLFTPGYGFWNIAASVTQPLLHGGQLMHQQRAAEAAFDQAAAQYRSTVVTAFQNVADALRALQSDALALKKAVEGEAAAAKSLNIMRDRLRLGDIGILALLPVQQTYQQALTALVQARAARYANTVALYQALGGGWWNRIDVAPEKPQPLDFPQ
jgi:NodT family efflux transporter outer membrane factor (OMF) lipoprotein